jgi:transposase
MSSRSSLSVVQRVSAVACFERGLGYRAVARYLDAPKVPVRGLYGLWRIHGEGVLVTKAPKSYSFEVKLALVQRFLAGETGPELAIEAGLSSRQLLQKWVRAYRLEGEDGLRPKTKGGPVKGQGVPAGKSGTAPAGSQAAPPVKSKSAPRKHEAGSSAKSGSVLGAGEVAELEQLRRENELLRAEVAYLGKLRALRAQQRR